VAEAARNRAVVGDPQQVAARLRRLAEEVGADELILTTLTHDPAARRRSYELVMTAMQQRAEARPVLS
jgi:alkanesulfonate monooxygenase SsuD/methylene tetrahydromethanopterin reductase-like flavin-dependent oxidoreductase (luciferase family)